MTDEQLIEHCLKKCRAPKPLFAAWRVKRMIGLAGNPRAFDEFIDGRSFYTMTDEMETLVELAKRRRARPATGLNIKVGNAYKDVNGDVRKVVNMPPHGRSFDVIWEGATGRGQSSLADFKEWSLEEVA